MATFHKKVRIEADVYFRSLDGVPFRATEVAAVRAFVAGLNDLIAKHDLRAAVTVTETFSHDVRT